MIRRDHALDLCGQRFGRWSVLSKSHRNERGEIFWLCRCDCGTERATRANHLRDGQSVSCGCYHREAVTKHGMTLTRTWKSWDSMLQRCENPKAPDYKNYGGRGIKVCQQWHDFKQFLADMGERPSGTTLERDKTNGNYTPKNCRWATASEQQRNKQSAIVATVGGITKSVHNWAEETGVPVAVIKWRIAKGWKHSEAIRHPVRPKKPPKGI